MTLQTIECRLYAPPPTLQFLWELMAKKNTPLINALLDWINHHPDFDTWFRQGFIPSAPALKFCNDLKEKELYQGQPGRFYSSALKLTCYMYKSWFAIQKKTQYTIFRKQHWLDMLKSDAELEQNCGQSIEQIEICAQIILQRTLEVQVYQDLKDKNKNLKRKKKKNKASKEIDLFDHFFKLYDESTESLSRCALAYLLKNNCRIPEEMENPEDYLQRRRRKEIEIERLQNQLQARLPNGRNLTGETWLETLNLVNHQIPLDTDEEAAWRAKLLTKSSIIPFPISYESNTDLTWLKNEQGHLLVKFNGMAKYPFEIRCDRRHLHWLHRFFEDQEIKKKSNHQHSSSLFTLRSARLLWREGKDKGEPWQSHHLYLQCSLETSFWTTEGTQKIAQEKIVEIQNYLEKLEQKKDLNKNQKDEKKYKQSTLVKINTSYPRPNKSLYQGNSAIIVGVSLGLDKPATVAIVDGPNQKVLTYRSIKQLLGENYHLLNRQRQQKQKMSHLRHQAQKKEGFRQFGESELGQYLDRLIAKAIVDLAQAYRAGSIALPEIKQVREITQSEIQAKAERKIPGYKDGQKQYAKQYRINVHQWSYGRLLDSIQQSAKTVGIAIEIIKQPAQGNPQEKAKNLAIAAYLSRLEQAL